MHPGRVPRPYKPIRCRAGHDAQIREHMGQGWDSHPTGGEPYCYDPCRLDYGTLIPLGFCYQVPGMRARYSNGG